MNIHKSLSHAVGHRYSQPSTVNTNIAELGTQVLIQVNVDSSAIKNHKTSPFVLIRIAEAE